MWLGKVFRVSIVSNDGETFKTLSWEREKAKGKLETVRIQDEPEENRKTLKIVSLDYGIFPKSKNIFKSNEGSEFFYILLLEGIKHPKS